MTWTNKQEGEIRDAIIQIAKEETSLNSFKEGGVLRGLIETLARTTYSLYRNSINFYSGQFTYMQASGLLLDLRGQELGVPRKEARKTQGTIEVTSTKAAVIPEGAWFITSSGLRYKSLSEISLSVGENNVPVEAEFPGALYNILAGSDIRTTSVLDGISRIIVPNAWITTPGRDKEPDENYRVRIQARWDSQGEDNRPAKYVVIALSIPGINDARIIRTPRGPGSIDLILGGTAGIPPNDVIATVRTAIEDSFLLARDILIKPATAKNQEFRLTFKGKPAASKVQETLRLWLQKRKIGEDVTMKALYQETLSALNINELEFQEPIQDIEIKAAEKVIPTSINASKES